MFAVWSNVSGGALADKVAESGVADAAVLAGRHRAAGGAGEVGDSPSADGSSRQVVVRLAVHYQTLDGAVQADAHARVPTHLVQRAAHTKITQ